MQQAVAVDTRILALAPTGRDAPLAVAALTQAGLAASACMNIDELCRQLLVGAGAVLIAAESLTLQAFAQLEKTLAQLPTWSDVPFLILTSSGATIRENGRAVDALRRIANVTLLERPLRIPTLVSTAQTALRARHRQYEVRDHLFERERQETELRIAALMQHDLRVESQAARDRLELVLASISDAFFILDAEWRFTHVNPRVSQLTDRTQEDLLARTFWEVFPHLTNSTFARRFTDAATTQAPIQFEDAQIVTDCWFDCRAYPTPDGLAVFLADITDRKQSERENRENLTRQQRIAETLQRSLLPKPRNYPGLEINSQYEAASAEAEVGGDFYDSFRIDERLVALVVGDVVGKGLSAATHTAEVKFALRAMLRENPHPALALERLNNFLFDAQRFDGGDQDQDQLVAMTLAVFDLVSHTLLVTAASAEPPLIIRVNSEIYEVKARGMVLGGNPKSTYEAETLHLGSGDMLIMVTDGITEARRGREFFEYEGFIRVAQEAHATHSFSEMGAYIIAEAKTFAGDKLRDDACLLLTRCE